MRKLLRVARLAEDAEDWPAVLELAPAVLAAMPDRHCSRRADLAGLEVPPARRWEILSEFLCFASGAAESGFQMLAMGKRKTWRSLHTPLQSAEHIFK